MILREYLKEFRIAFWYYQNRIRAVDSNKAVFCNYNGKGFGCNPKYIAIEMLKRNPSFDIVWIVENDDYQFPKGIRTVLWNSKEAIYELSTAAIWVDNQRKLWYHRKRKKQFFVETWHGGAGPIKKIGADNPANFHNKPYKHTSRHMNKITDIMVSNGTMRSEIYQRAFLYTGYILECGAPRNDILVRGWEVCVPQIHNFFNIPRYGHIVIYAPTYRKGRQTTTIKLEGHEILSVLRKKFGGEWYMLKRLHPTMAEHADEFSYDTHIINASEYDDMQELLAASDVLISDYSSVISEFSIMEKPIFLYAEDIKSYEQERSFYIDYFKLPYPIAVNKKQLLFNILSFDAEDYQKKLRKYHCEIGSKETGIATKTVVDIISKHCALEHD